MWLVQGAFLAYSGWSWVGSQGKKQGSWQSGTKSWCSGSMAIDVMVWLAELDAAETVDQSSFVIYDLATVHLYIQSLDCFQILYLHPFIACTLADNGVSKPWLKRYLATVVLMLNWTGKDVLKEKREREIRFTWCHGQDMLAKKRLSYGMILTWVLVMHKLSQDIPGLTTVSCTFTCNSQ